MADAFADRLDLSLQTLTQQFPSQVDVPIERRFTGLDGYQKAVDALGEGGVVILATPPGFRPPHFEYAVEQSRHVFMEKSFAVDAPAARRLMKAAEASEQKGLKVAAGFMWRHSQAREEVIRRIHDGAIGDVHTLRIYRVHGPVHSGPKPANANELEFQIRRPFSFNWLTGGFFIDWHCHNVDVACWAKGAWPVAAQGMGGRCYADAGNLFDHYTVEFTFADGAKLFAFSRHMANCWNEYADFAHGSRGSAVLMASLNEPKPRIYKSQQMVDDQVVWKFDGADPNPYHAEWQLLLDAIRQDKPHNEARRAAEANVAALMGRMAVHTGAYISWDQAINSNFQYVADIDSLGLDSPAPIQAGPDGMYAAPQPGVTQEC
jgi:predicted dehydrogenase